MNKDIENLKAIVEDLEDADNGAMIRLKQAEIESLKNIYNLIEKQRKENEMLKKITQKITAICNYEMTDDYIVVCSLDYFNKGYFKNNFIRKDKIKEKIKEVSGGIYDAKFILEKLLEET